MGVFGTMRCWGYWPAELRLKALALLEHMSGTLIGLVGSMLLVSLGVRTQVPTLSSEHVPGHHQWYIFRGQGRVSWTEGWAATFWPPETGNHSFSLSDTSVSGPKSKALCPGLFLTGVGPCALVCLWPIPGSLASSGWGRGQGMMRRL